MVVTTVFCNHYRRNNVVYHWIGVFLFSGIQDVSILIVIQCIFTTFICTDDFHSLLFIQAPESMKSVLQAAWLLNVAFGNIIVIIVAEAKAFDSQVSILSSSNLSIVLPIFGL